MSANTDKPTEGKFQLGPALQGDVVQEAWNSRGQPVDPDSIEAVVKRSTDPASGNVRCWVRRAATGPEAGSLYDPNSVFSQGSPPHRVRGDAGNAAFPWRPSSPECLANYLLYLQTNNPIHKRHAERS